MIDSSVVTVMLLAALGLGQPIARLIGLRTAGRPETLIFGTALGWAGLSMSLLALGGLGLVGFQILSFMFPAISVGCLLVTGFVALKKYALWLVAGSLAPRYALSIYPIAALLMVWFASTFTWRSAITRPALYGVVALQIVALLSRKAYDWAANTLPVVFGQESQEDSPNRKLYGYGAYQFANTQLPDSAKLFTFPDSRIYYLNRPYIWGCPHQQATIEYDHYDSSSDLLHKLGELGITHIIVHPPVYPHHQRLARREPELIAYAERAIQLVEGLNSLGLNGVLEANGVTICALPNTPQTHQDNPRNLTLRASSPSLCSLNGSRNAGIHLEVQGPSLVNWTLMECTSKVHSC